ncbi:tRNA pseudouridine synthase 1 [Entomophthora muscae]|uniref:tRNA pseudouridine synthase 1 n=1 Tax=Entomophthora muscae TaxID=34485 RepID=A0ACC2TJ66_9FUNG|nr:tRNA pseudouridine synthase 1 [Entomophthora muscae]
MNTPDSTVQSTSNESIAPNENVQTPDAMTVKKDKKIRFPTAKQRREHFEMNKRTRSDDTWPTTRKEHENKEPSGPRLPKKKVALLMGFSGTGYSGMMFNPNAKKTIEDDLFSALCLSGAVSKDNSTDIKKVSFMRAARTDKGVSAAGQVCSLKMIVDIDDIIKKINDHLPAQIRVFGYVKTMRAFHAKNCCSSRIYEYLLPTYTLAPRSEPVEQVSDGQQIPPVDPTEMELKHAFRADTATISLVREALEKYVGTRNYHNFTIRRSFKEKASNRFITSFTASNPFVVDGIEWISLKVHGQSFMLHQIRKMVAMVVMLVRSNTPLSVLTRAFEEQKINIPKAPGLGLLLERPLFDSFNDKQEKGRESYDPIDFSSVQEEMDQFKTEFIYPNITQEEKSGYTFETFLRQVDYFPQHYQYLNPEGTIPEYQPSSMPVGSDDSEPDSDTEA